MANADEFSGAIFLDFSFACQADDETITSDAQRFEADPTSPLCELIHLLSVLVALQKFDVPEYEVKSWYEKKHAERWVSMFSAVKFYDIRLARQVGEYPALVAMWDNPIPRKFRA